jgi:L-glyceraldehyde 3-phosphate reductase
MLTDKYLGGIPADARAARSGSFSPDFLTERNIAHVRGLNELAKERGQTLAQMAISWALRDKRVTSALIGARNLEQLEDSLAAVRSLPFSDAELARIDQHATDAGIDIWKSSKVMETA